MLEPNRVPPVGDLANLPPDWHTCTPGEAALLEQELRRELAASQSLFGVRATAVARSSACDDVLFAVEAAPPFLAIVHLTWRGSAEAEGWPHVQRFDSLESLRAHFAQHHDG